MLEQGAGDGGARRRLEGCTFSARYALPHLLVREPAGVLELGGVDGEFRAWRLCVAAEHERRREGPWLARDVAHVPNVETCFLHHLARYRRLDRFTHFHEPRER